MRYTITKSLDRGIKCVLEKSGKSMVFEPEVKWRKYVKQYILSERNDVEYLTCKNCGKISRCGIVSLETDLKLYGLTVENLHEYRYAVCTACGKTFIINKEDGQ